MVVTPLVRIEEIEYALGDGTQSLFDLSLSAVRKIRAKDIGGVIAATFSNGERFPALSVRLASEFALPASTPAFDIQMACSAYPYAVYLAGRLAADTGRRILVVDGDVQSRFVDRADPATGAIFSDAVTASIVSSDAQSQEKSCFDFLSCADPALQCAEGGPIRMDGMKVFTFVATSVRSFLKDFMASAVPAGDSFAFAPHQANPYMIRQLAKALNVENRLLTLDEKLLNPGSCSVPLTLATNGWSGRALIAGFGAGYSASVGWVACDVLSRSAADGAQGKSEGAS